MKIQTPRQFPVPAPLMVIGRYLLSPRSPDPGAMFRERTIRFVTVVAVVTLTILAIFNRWYQTNTASMVWNATLYLFAFGIYYFLHRGQVTRAAYVMSFSAILIILDQTAAYWSPGTITFTIMYSLLFNMIHERPRDVGISVVGNLLLYTLVTLKSSGTSPLSSWDYFASPLNAMVITIAVNIMMVGIAHFIRQEQYQRDQVELWLEQQESDVLRQFLGNASHDLRTILSRIRLNSELARRTNEDGDNRFLLKLDTGVNQLEQSLLLMFEMSQLDDQSQLTFTSVSLTNVINDLLAQYTSIFTAKAIHLHYHDPRAAMYVRGDEELLRRAAENVLLNGLEHTPADGNVTISLTKERGFAILQISDTGTGITQADLPHIFERFFRGDAARSNPDGHVGLGLPIARRIIQLHRGDIYVESELGVGTRVTIKIPTA